MRKETRMGEYIWLMEVLFWYDVSPRLGQVDNSIPYKVIFNYECRHIYTVKITTEEIASVQIGDEVWIKLPGACFILHWNRETVMNMLYLDIVSADEISQHFRDICQLINSFFEGTGDEG